MSRFFGVVLALVLVCSISPVALQAQHHGGGGGVHNGGGIAARPSGSLGRPITPFVNPPVSTFGRAPIIGRPFERRVRPAVVAPVYGYGYGYGYSSYPYDYYSPYYAPTVAEPYYSEPQPVYAPGPADASSQSDAELSYQVGRLTQEVEDLRQQQAVQSQQAQAAPSGSRFSPIVLIYKDGHRMEIQNYAIIGQTLWVLDEKNSAKVSLDDLNLDATQSENRARGVRFSVPSK